MKYGVLNITIDIKMISRSFSIQMSLILPVDYNNKLKFIITVVKKYRMLPQRYSSD